MYACCYFSACKVLTYLTMQYALNSAHSCKSADEGAVLFLHLISLDLASSSRHHEKGITPTTNQSRFLFSRHDLLRCERVAVVNVNHFRSCTSMKTDESHRQLVYVERFCKLVFSVAEGYSVR